MILMTVKDNDCDGRNDIKDIRVEGATDDELLYSIGVLTFIAKDLGHCLLQSSVSFSSPTIIVCHEQRKPEEQADQGNVRLLREQ